jgi:hypothetical protein
MLATTTTPTTPEIISKGTLTIWYVTTALAAATTTPKRAMAVRIANPLSSWLILFSFRKQELVSELCGPWCVRNPRLVLMKY